MNVTILTVSALSLAVSVTTLTLLVFGGRRARKEVKEVETKVNVGFSKFRDALNQIEM